MSIIPTNRLTGIGALALLALAIPSYAATYSAEIHWTEPTTNVDGSPLTDLDRYEAELHIEGQGSVLTETINAPTAAPAVGSVLQHVLGSIPVAGGESVFVLLRACDGATHPDTGDPLNNCSAWATSNPVVMPTVDIIVPAGPTEINITISVIVP